MERGVFTAEEIDRILKSMGIKGRTAVMRYGSGYINDTFKVDVEGGCSYILQHVNTKIFTPEALNVLKRTVLRVTEYLKTKGLPTLDFVAYENPWRLFKFYSGYSAFNVIESPEQAYVVGKAFAGFHDSLSDLPAPRLEEVLPGFHNTRSRLADFDEAMLADRVGRVSKVGREIDFVNSRRAHAERVMSLLEQGELPERVIHSDSKINNVLVAPNGEAVVIDLDTVMPGSILSDFGDMVRTSTASAAEDEADLSKVYSRLDYFEALARGYIERARFLSSVEVANLVFAGQISTFEVGVRFLTDYLNGDLYFRVNYPEHNIVRARNQFKMVESLEANASAYEEIVSRLYKVI